MASKRKTTSAVIAVALAAAILLGGTFAWQSISQEALNEVYGFVNPGGRLHDDFHEITVETDTTRQFDKNVYVENFTTILEDGVQIFARVRLDEYMEVGVGAGTIDQDKKAVSLDPNPEAKFDDVRTWRTHIPDDTTDPFHDYWTWDMAGEADGGVTAPVTYMPTFNKNKDSVEPDVNGTFAGPNGVNDKVDAFDDYVEYTVDENGGGTYSLEGYEVYDADNDTEDQLDAKVDLDTVIEKGKDHLDSSGWSGWNNHVAVSEQQVDHHAKPTLSSKVITMESWLSRSAEDQIGPYWVWDEDGWAYWAQPIDPSTATGVFLDGIARTTEIINEDWYYGINVVAQFITSDGLGREDGTGFYNAEKGKVPSYNALKLLDAIGVEVNTNVDDVVKLDAALALGGNITLGEAPIAADSVVSFGNEETNFNWHGGGTLNSGTLVAEQKAYAGLFINAEKGWPVSGDGAVAATVNGTVVQAGADVTFAVYAQAVHENVTLNNMTVTARNGGILAEWNNEEKPTTVTLNNVNVTIASAHSTYWVNSAVAAANGAKVVINGGTYDGEYAAYVFSSGGTIIINDGDFIGMLQTDAGEIIIKGGTFTSDPRAYLAEGYTAEWSDDAGRWVVSKIAF